MSELFQINKMKVTSCEPDYKTLVSRFAWTPMETIKKTFKATTQYARNIYYLPLRKHFRLRFPALNVHRRKEAAAT